MGWSLGYDDKWKRWIGYGVPAYCDHPGCEKKIHRGLSYVCGGEPFGGDDGCGLHFCEDHLWLEKPRYQQKCERCYKGAEPFDPRPEHPEWVNHLLTDESWQQWRDENPGEVAKMKEAAA